MKKYRNIIHWAPRILCVMAILFISLFALDSFNPELSIWQQIGVFFIHLIPSFILLALLLVSWKWEYVGGFIFITIGLIFSPIIFIHNYNMNQSIWMSLGIIMAIIFPFIVVGILIVWSYKMKKRSSHISNKSK